MGPYKTRKSVQQRKYQQIKEAIYMFWCLDAWDKYSGLVHWEEPEGSGGEGGGRSYWDGEYM